MIEMPLPFAFIQAHVTLTWRDALWGYERQMVGWSGIVDLAKNRLCDHSVIQEIELACLGKSEAFQVGVLLRELAASEPEQQGSMSAKKWLFLAYAWLFDHKDSVEDPLGAVEEIYAEFDYPIEVESFVRYLPPTGGYDPSQYSKKENEARLMANWQQYLVVAEQSLKAPSYQ